MILFAIGLNHRTAPIELRERLAIDEVEAVRQLQDLCSSKRSNGAEPSERQMLQEAVLLSTCNRVELFGLSATPEEGHQALEIAAGKLAAFGQLPVQEVRPHLYCHVADRAIHHLMRVSCGLDSPMLGEVQILGQVRDALAIGHQAGSAGPLLTQLFERALRAGKRARGETSINRLTTNIGHVAVQMAAIQPHAAEAHVLIIGTGEIATLAAKALQQRKFSKIGCLNRTYDRAKMLMNFCNGRVFHWHEMDTALAWADVVIAATRASQPIIRRQNVCATRAVRKERPLVLIDLALPRNIDPNCDELPGVVRYDIDDLQASRDTNLALQRSAIPAVETIINEEQISFSLWCQSRAAAPAIVALRGYVEKIAQEELTLALAQLSHLNGRDQATIERLVHRLTNKVLHQPTVHLRTHGWEPTDSSVAEVATSLFGLSDRATSPLQWPVACDLWPGTAEDPAVGVSLPTDH